MDSLVSRLAAFFAAAPDVHVVGGAVRDRLLGRPVHDFDLVVAGDALVQARRLADALGAAYVPLDADFGTARVVVGEDQVDIAQQRGGSLDADLRLRDFTVNAMAVPLARWEDDDAPIIDPTGGQADLQARLVRAVSPQAFQTDPGRLLRAPRLAAQLDATLEPQTEAWLRRDAGLLLQASMERLRDEFWRCLLLPGTADLVRRLDELGLLGRLLPDVPVMQGVTQRPPHTLDVYDHSLAALANTELILGALDVGGGPGEAVTAAALAPFRDDLRRHLLEEPVRGRPRWSLLKFVALLHDVGKPATRSVQAGLVHFYDHDLVGAAMIERIGQGFKLSSREVAWLKLVVRQHLRPLFLAQHMPPSARAQYRYFRDTGEVAPDVLLLSIADNRSKAFPTVGSHAQDAHADTILDLAVAMLRLFYHTPDAPVVSPPPLVNGNDIMQATGLRPGPRVGEVLERVREAIATGRVTTRDEALALARHMQRDSGGARPRGK